MKSTPLPLNAANHPDHPGRGGLERLAVKVTDWSERWFPDSYIFAAIAVIVVALGAMAIGAPAHGVARAFGDGFWSLIPFTMQMAVVAISGYEIGRAHV